MCYSKRWVILPNFFFFLVGYIGWLPTVITNAKVLIRTLRIYPHALNRIILHDLGIEYLQKLPNCKNHLTWFKQLSGSSYLGQYNREGTLNLFNIHRYNCLLNSYRMSFVLCYAIFHVYLKFWISLQINVVI